MTNFSDSTRKTRLWKLALGAIVLLAVAGGAYRLLRGSGAGALRASWLGKRASPQVLRPIPCHPGRSEAESRDLLSADGEPGPG